MKKEAQTLFLAATVMAALTGCAVFPGGRPGAAPDAGKASKPPEPASASESDNAAVADRNQSAPANAAAAVPAQQVTQTDTPVEEASIAPEKVDPEEPVKPPEGWSAVEMVQFEQGLAALESGDFVIAEQRFTLLSDKHPDSAAVWVNLGTAAMGGGNEDKARRAYTKAVALNDKLVEAHNRLGVIHARRGEFSQAEQAYRRALQVAPDEPLAHLNLGILLERDLAQPAQALEHYRRFQQLSDKPDPQVEKWILQLER